MRLPLFSSAALLAASLCAQTVVVPSAAAAAEGASSSSYPWNTTSAAMHVQYCYDSSSLGGQSVGAGTITRLRFRANGGGSCAGGSYSNVVVELATATADQSALSPVFASNFGPDRTVVYSGAVAVAPIATTASPNAFYVDLPLTTPFVYDPAAGDLLIDIQIPANSWTGTGSTSVDIVAGTGTLGSRLWSLDLTSTTAASGLQPDVAMVVAIDRTPIAGYALAAPFGSGCGRLSRSFYELFAAGAAFDLAYTAFTLVPVDNTYVGVVMNPFLPPSAAATTLTLADDGEIAVPLNGTFAWPGGATNTLVVCANGFVSAASGNGTGYAPSAADWHQSPLPRWGSHHDYNPAQAGSGAVKFERVGTVACVTWDRVWDYGGTSTANANTFQLQFDLASGFVTYAFGTMSVLGPSHLVGFAAGGASVDSGGLDLSAALPNSFATSAVDYAGMALGATGRPIVGSSMQLVSDNGLGASFAFHVAGLVQYAPGIDLAPLGAPGCLQHVSTDVSQFLLPSGGRFALPLTVPNNPQLLGTRIFCQHAAGVPQNPLGLITSNGIQLVVGSR